MASSAAGVQRQAPLLQQSPAPQQQTPLNSQNSIAAGAIALHPGTPGAGASSMADQVSRLVTAGDFAGAMALVSRMQSSTTNACIPAQQPQVVPQLMSAAQPAAGGFGGGAALFVEPKTGILVTSKAADARHAVQAITATH